MRSQFMQQSMRSTIDLVGIMLQVRDAKESYKRGKLMQTIIQVLNNKD